MEMVNDTTFESEVLQAEGLVVVDFGATWCGPCKKIEPIIEELGQEYEGRMKVRKVDVGEAPGVAQKFRVLSVPQVLFFKDGNVVDTIVGVVPKPKIVEKIDANL